MYIGLKISFIYSIFPKHASYYQNTYLVHLIKFCPHETFMIFNLYHQKENVYFCYICYLKNIWSDIL